MDVEQFGDLFGLADLPFVVVDFVDFKEGADLHQHQRILAVLLLEVLLQLEVDLGQKFLFL